MYTVQYASFYNAELAFSQTAFIQVANTISDYRRLTLLLILKQRCHPETALLLFYRIVAFCTAHCYPVYAHRYSGMFHVALCCEHRPAESHEVSR